MSHSDEKPILPPFGEIRNVKINTNSDRPCFHYVTHKVSDLSKNRKSSSVCNHPDHVLDEVHEE